MISWLPSVRAARFSSEGHAERASTDTSESDDAGFDITIAINFLRTRSLVNDRQIVLCASYEVDMRCRLSPRTKCKRVRSRFSAESARLSYNK